MYNNPETHVGPYLDDVILPVKVFVGFAQAAGVVNKTDDDHAETFDESTEQDVLICQS